MTVTARTPDARVRSSGRDDPALERIDIRGQAPAWLLRGLLKALQQRQDLDTSLVDDLVLVPLAEGSDMGGSLRNPAAFTNVVGFRPSPGRVPNAKGLFPWFTLATEGPMARNVPICTSKRSSKGRTRFSSVRLTSTDPPTLTNSTDDAPSSAAASCVCWRTSASGARTTT